MRGDATTPAGAEPAPPPDRRRYFNEDRRRLFGAANDQIAFVCECGDADCRAAVVLSPAEYDAARQAAPHVLLHDRHVAAPQQ